MTSAVPRKAGSVAVDALAFKGFGSKGPERSAKGLCSSMVDVGVVIFVLAESVPTEVAIEFSLVVLVVKDELVML